MTGPKHERLRRLFEAALGLPAAERSAFLAAGCGEDQALHRQLVGMLAAADDEHFLASPTLDPAVAAKQVGLATPPEPAPAAAPGDDVGAQIGPYRLLSQLGQGGFGMVFLAEQQAPVVRQVALKVLKLGMDTRQVVARFEQERQVLALMDHPHIARVLDAGSTATGRPYFVMDLVRGEPITAFCDANHLSIDDRLRLFAQVCDAVQHAHAKGVIHRDIKSSNILVAMHDGKPSAKVIDFGIAKATAQKLTEDTLTEHRQVVGTLQYMSPEQAEGSADIDTRTDVYSLGVLLYELLTGSTPFDRQTIRAAMYEEVKRLIREVEPPRPSTRLSQSDMLANIAAQRRTAPQRLGSLLRGDLDWIVMKALEKERERRYETAAGLAQDVQRHLAGETVTAAPPSAVYRFRKFVRRNRGTVVAITAVGASLVAGLIAFAWQAHLTSQRATQLAQVASFQERMLGQIDATALGLRLMGHVREQHAAGLAGLATTQAEREGRRAAFLQELARVNATDAAKTMVDAAFLQPAVDAVASQFADQPLVDAQLRQTLATIHTKLGRYDAALKLQEAALAIQERVRGDAVETARARGELARILDNQGKHESAEPLHRAALASQTRLVGPDHPEALAALANLGGNLRSQRKFAAAEPMLQQVLEASIRVLGPEHRDTLVRRNLMGFLRIDQGRAIEAEPWWREAFEVGQRVFGPDDPDVIVWTNNFGGLLNTLGRARDAERYYRLAAEAAERVHGRDHPMTWTGVDNVAGSLVEQGRFAEAEPMTRDVLERRRLGLGDEHPETLLSQSRLGTILAQLGRMDEAEPMLRGVWETRRRLHGMNEAVLVGGSKYASFLANANRVEEAERLYRELLASSADTWGADHPDRLVMINNLGVLLLKINRPAEAEPQLREAFAARRRVSGDEHPETLVVQSTYARSLENQGRLDEAEPLYRDATTKFRRVLGDDHPNTLVSICNLGQVLLGKQRFAEAELPLREAVEGLVRRLGESHTRTTTARRSLARAMLGQRRFADAERELLALEAVVAGIPDASGERKAACCDELARCHEEWHAAEPAAGHDATAASWRQKAVAARRTSDRK
jgi:serine/threonine protein kinase/tetratricopeptide (TPR) repeat protein